MSAAVTGPAPRLTSLSVRAWCANERSRSFFTFSTIWVTSSLTFSIVLNSWKTPAIWMLVTAAPSREGVAQRDAVPLLEGADLERAEVALRRHLFDARRGDGLLVLRLRGLEFDHEREVTPSASSTRRRAAR